MKTAVSVIVPCYNVAPYVDECMSGLAEQTLGPMEIICVDDGSTDGTLELLYRWREKDNRLRVISQSNAGVSAAGMPGWMPRRENTWALWTRMTGWTGGCSRACLAPLKRMMRTSWCAVAGNSWKKTVWSSMRAAGPRMMNFIRRNGWSNSAAVPPGAGAWVPYTTNWSAEAWWKNIPSVLWWA